MTNQKKKRGPPPKGSRPTPQRTSPAFVTPMAAQVVKRLPEGDDWTYEFLLHRQKPGCRGGARRHPDCDSLRDMCSRARVAPSSELTSIARDGRAPPPHGGAHGRRPSAPHAATPGNVGPASTRPAPRRGDPRVPGFQLAGLPPDRVANARQGPRFPVH